MKIFYLRTKSGFYRTWLFVIGIITFSFLGSACGSISRDKKYGPPPDIRKMEDSIAMAEKQDSLKKAQRKADSLANIKTPKPVQDTGKIHQPKKYGPRPVQKK
jgi:hypothetical protein